MKVLVSGAAGFIGFHLVKRLLNDGYEVVGIDNMNDYYSPQLKADRLHEVGIECKIAEYGVMVPSRSHSALRFVVGDIADRVLVQNLFATEHFDMVVNLAAQAGVRYSLENPFAYVESNVVGFLNILECCRHNAVKHLVYASSSSVYGSNSKTPFAEQDSVDRPESLYAATKRSDELMASVYAKLYGIPATGLRFFTVYGPWGRPDMAPMLFAEAIAGGQPIKLFNKGRMQRDFTYIDDIIEGVVRVMAKPPVKGEDDRPHAIYNIGCSSPVMLDEFIAEIEQALNRKALRVLMPMQAGDVERTFADTTLLEQRFGYRPQTTLHEGIGRFIEWFKSYNSKK